MAQVGVGGLIEEINTAREGRGFARMPTDRGRGGDGRTSYRWVSRGTDRGRCQRNSANLVGIFLIEPDVAVPASDKAPSTAIRCWRWEFGDLPVGCDPADCVGIAFNKPNVTIRPWGRRGGAAIRSWHRELTT